jgi:Lon protease-like protein
VSTPIHPPLFDDVGRHSDENSAKRRGPQKERLIKLLCPLCNTMIQSHLVYFLLLALPCCRAFLSQNLKATSSPLFGISEWRDTMFSFPGSDRRIGTETGAPPKEICILPFPFSDVLLQGETKQLRLYEERFIKLFDTSMEKHSGMVGMGLLADSGIVQIVPLCEIEAYNRMDEFGIFVTLRVVGRARLLELTQQEPHIKAVCVEVADKLPPTMELPNLVASNIENFMLVLSAMEHRLSKQEKKKEEDNEMKRRINIAQLVRRMMCSSCNERDHIKRLTVLPFFIPGGSILRRL